MFLEMLYEISDLSLSLVPGLIGFFVSVTLGLRLNVYTLGGRAVLGGAGGCLGYIVMAILIRLQDEAGGQVFSPTFVSVLWGLLVTSVILFFWIRKSALQVADGERAFGVTKRGFQRLAALALVILLGASLSQTVLQVAVTPVVGWDALELWTKYANFFLQFDQGFADFRYSHYGDGLPRAEGGRFPLNHHRHPLTGVHLSAFAGFAMQGSELLRGWLVPWTAIWLCGGAAIFGFASACFRSLVMPLLALLAYSSLPLLANHAVLVGYADFWVATAVSISVALFALGLIWRRSIFWLLGFLCALIPVGLKNTGLMYTATVMMPLVAVWAINSFPKTFWIALATAAMAAIWFYVSGFDLEIAGQRFALIRGEEAMAFAGGYDGWSFDSYPLADIFWNEFWALMVNQSFSVVVLLLLISAAALFRHEDSFHYEYKQALLYLLVVSVTLLAAFAIPQLVRMFAELYAEPGSDIGLSRFMLAVGPIAIMAALLAAKSLECGTTSIT